MRSLKNAFLVVALGVSTAFAQGPYPAPIVSISVLNSQPVLAPDGSGNPINSYGGLTTLADEHSTIFPAGTLPGQSDYWFWVAARTSQNDVSSGLVVLKSVGLPDASGRWTLDFAPGYGPGQVFLSPVDHDDCPTVSDGNPAHQDQTFDLNYADPGTVAIDPTNNVPGSLLMVYEGTTRCIGLTGGGNAGSSFYSTVAAATSLDDGRDWPSYRFQLNANGVPQYPVPKQSASVGPEEPSGASGNLVCIGNDCSAPPWPPAGSYGRYAVLGPQVTIGAAMASPVTKGGLSVQMGDSEPSAFVDDASSNPAQFIYEIHNYAPGPSGLGNPPIAPPFDLNSDMMIARAQLNGGSAPLEFKKWDGTSFSEAGLGGLETPIFPVGSPAGCQGTGQLREMGSISYVEAAQQYLLVFVCRATSDPLTQAAGPGAAWFYSTSYNIADPTQWSTPKEIAGSWSTLIPNDNGCEDYAGWYPSLMSLNTRPGHLSTSGYVFYMVGCTGDAAGNGSGPPPSRVFSSRAFTITTGPSPQINSGGIVIHGGASGMVSPGSLADIYGTGLAATAANASAGPTLPTTLGGVQVRVNGTPAPLIYVSPLQIVFQLPYETVLGTASVVVVSNNTASAAVPVSVQQAAPFILTYGNNRAVVINPDGSLNSSGNGAKPGSVLVAYLTGSGPLDHAIATGAAAPSSPLSSETLATTATVGNSPAAVQFAGMAPTYEGLMQVNLVVPNLSPGDYAMQVAIGGSASNRPLVTVSK
jgi:uncharacterized protein (TIGR03437 family)